MPRRPLLPLTLALAAVLMLAPGVAFGATVLQKTPSGTPKSLDMSSMPRMRAVTMAQRWDAARGSAKSTIIRSLGLRSLTSAPLGVLDPLGTPDYFGGVIPNYATSPLPETDSAGNVIPGTGIRKFVDSLPGLGPANANDLGQYLPVAVPDTITYPGCDYYEIGLVQYKEKLHKDLPATTLRGYVQLNTTDPKVGRPSYLGPTIIAHRNRPVRVKFTNMLPTGADGNLFLPVDTTIMGAGLGPTGEPYTQNRATLHLHGGTTPWISDGTPHQWTTPAGENTNYPRGVSVYNVPDMPDPGPGSLTFFYTNQQSARLMFYHDHSYGITRLNVYAGEAAGYVLDDPVEQKLVNGGTIGSTTVRAGTVPAEQIPLIIQDKTFVPKDTQLAAQDPTWDKAHWGAFGNLWFPHVYMPNQNPNDISGTNPMGRWDYGPWFWPPFTGITHGPTVDGNPGTPNPSLVPEAFMDTPVVNGTAYPYLKVGRKAYRFRILNASNDRTLNLQLYFAKSNTPAKTDAAGAPTLQTDSGEVPMVPAVAHPNDPAWPSTWPTDGRTGGVPDPRKAGPKMIQIGTEGGLLPAPAVLDNTPVGYSYDRRSIVVLNVTNKTLFLGPAERADVIIDFSQVPAGTKLIMYNDAPAPVPAFDSRLDYYTGDPDQTAVGGAPTTRAGYGPNTRTVMQFQVVGNTAAPAYDVNALRTALPAAFRASQDPIVVPQKAYGDATDTVGRIQDTTMTFSPEGTTTPVALPLESKAIQELFESNYGRMNATLGVELPFTNMLNQTTLPFGYVDPATEIVKGTTDTATPIGSLKDGTQIWKIVHNGVDTHAIHVHMFNMQVINRVGWDNAVSLPDANELGWKDTVRMNPLEIIFVAVRPIVPNLPFKIGDSVRLLDPTQPEGGTMGFANFDAAGNPVTVKNEKYDFGWEYVWHCHLLGHEENDMMRPMVIKVSPAAPTTLSATVASSTEVDLAWSDNATDPAATNLRIERSPNAGFFGMVTTFTASADATTFADTTVSDNQQYYYRVRAENTNSFSAWTNVASATIGTPPSDTTPPTTTASFTPDPNGAGWNTTDVRMTLNATDNAGGSGVADTFYQLNMFPAQKYSGSTTTMSVEGSYTVSFWSVDNAGNVEATNTATLRIDKTPPLTSCDATDSWTGTTTVTFNPMDWVSGVASFGYVLDGHPLAHGTSFTAGLGTHAVSFAARDNAGNVEPTRTVTFSIRNEGRMAGTDRLATAVAVAQKAFPGTAPAAVVAFGYNFPDALAAAPLAKAYGGPVLLTATGGLRADVLAELKHLSPSRVFIVGGTSVVSNNVASQLSALPSHPAVSRLAGADRFETSTRIAAQLQAKAGYPGRAVVVPGYDYHDALIAAPLAAAKGWPVLLTAPTSLPGVVAASIGRLHPSSTLVVGDTTEISNGVMGLLPSPVRIGWADHYAQSTAMLQYAKTQGVVVRHVGLAVGTDYPDGLVAGAYLAKDNGLLLLTQPTVLPSVVSSTLATNKSTIQTLDAFGGTNVVSYDVVAAAKAVMGN